MKHLKNLTAKYIGELKYVKVDCSKMNYSEFKDAMQMQKAKIELQKFKSAPEYQSMVQNMRMSYMCINEAISRLYKAKNCAETFGFKFQDLDTIEKYANRFADMINAEHSLRDIFSDNNDLIGTCECFGKICELIVKAKEPTKEQIDNIINDKIE